MDGANRKTRGPYAKGIARRAEILRAALAVFAEQGDRTSLKDIADRVGLSEAGVLHYFGSREGLLLAVLAQRDENSVAAAVERHRGHALGALAEIARDNVREPGLVRLYASLSMSATDPGHPLQTHFAERYAATRELIAHNLRTLQAQGRVRPELDAVAVAALAIAALDGLQVQWLYDGDVDMAAAMEILVGLIVDAG
ncbi:TetR/AcrR family transcriptional regulator [Streptomyces sp. ISL-43]|uniref:TetR/AcrR family transcriptional regulator n=1 Tax=Streptomyces sp. ISL-43 TaxID=2819183 RepID=UPI001BE7B363|nr:TetR/AcrR family transcriptional regulator [Streptomyces sp. ISL-43]MBT2452248.1 TetR/AcrR family transcriptional regulator [Streptomyces sp. ISL-43]